MISEPAAVADKVVFPELNHAALRDMIAVVQNQAEQAATVSWLTKRICCVASTGMDTLNRAPSPKVASRRRWFARASGLLGITLVRV